MFGSKTFLGSLSTATTRHAFAVRRHFATQMKSYPSYSVFGEKCMLSLKLLPPAFKYIDRSQSIVLDGAKKGRMLLEWIPRNEDGKQDTVVVGRLF